MKRILCYGDSNTWGYISGTNHQRYNEKQRWTKLLQLSGGGYFDVVEEGLNSRTLFSDDNRPGKEGRNGFTYLKPCLDTHDKIDIVILMLGTNELKNEFNNSAEEVLQMLIKYIDFIKNNKSQIDKTVPQVILSGIPTINEQTEYCKQGNKYKGATAKSKNLGKLCKRFCSENNICYIDNQDLETGVDGVHLTLESHKKLASRIADVLKNC